LSNFRFNPFIFPAAYILLPMPNYFVYIQGALLMLQAISSAQATAVIRNAQVLLNSIEQTSSEDIQTASLDLTYIKNRLGQLHAKDGFTYLNDEELEELQTLHHALTVEHEALTTSPQSSVAGWGELKELPVTLPTAPKMSLELLPPTVRVWIADEAERASLNPEMIVVAFLVALGGVVGRRVGVHPKQNDPWLVVPNLWGAIVAPPSSIKSHALKVGTGFLHALEERDTQVYKERMDASETQRRVLEMEMVRIENKIKNGGSTSALTEELEKNRKALSDLQLPEPRRIVNDATIEKMGEILNDNPNGLTCIRDELAGLLNSYDKQGREGDRAFYLEAWNGTGSFTVDRISRKPVRIKALTLSLIGSIQPGKLARHVAGAVAGAGEADGLLQRFQLLIFPDALPKFEYVDRAPNTEAFEAVCQLVEKLDSLDFVALGAVVDNRNGIPTLRFTPEAQEVFKNWYTPLQHECRGEALAAVPAYQTHLSKYGSLMAKLALLFHLLDVANGTATSGAISKEAAELAVAWCEFLRQHAKKLYAVELARATNPVLEMAERIELGEITDGLPLREIQHKGIKGCSTIDKVRETLRELEKLNWVKIEKIKKSTKPSEVIRINPVVYEA
jgi:Protein of unknown function (DUF3987)